MIKLPTTFNDMVQSIISNDNTFSNIRSLQPNIYFDISIQSSFSNFTVNDIDLFKKRIRDFSIPSQILQTYKPLNKIERFDYNSKTIYYRPYYIIPKTNIDSNQITITFIDDINLTLTNKIFNISNYHFTTKTDSQFILFDTINIDYYTQDNGVSNIFILGFEYKNLTLNDIEYQKSFSRTSNDFISVSVTLQFTDMNILLDKSKPDKTIEIIK